MDAARFRTAAMWLGVIAAAILVFMVSWAIGSSVFRAAPAASVSPVTTPVDTAPDEPATPATGPTRPGPGLPSINLPSPEDVAREAALRAGIAGVDAALATLPTDTPDGERTSAALKKAWAAASEDLLADKKPRQALEKFRDQVDKQRDDGNLRLWEAEAVKLALSAVEALVPAA